METKYKEGNRVKYRDDYYIVTRAVGYFCDLRSGDGLRSINWIHEDELTRAEIGGRPKFTLGASSPTTCTCSAIELTTGTPQRGCPEHWAGSMDPKKQE